MVRWRLIIDPKLTGPENMAVDESILREAESPGVIMPTLRVYGWSSPTISIGYLQKAGPFASCGLPMVRRITGGRAVLHDNELTYSVIAATDEEPFSGGITAAYSAISRCIMDALGRSGVFSEFSRASIRGGNSKEACFHTAARYEVLVGGRKLVGSSQRRFKRCFLQHGSILLGIDKGMNRRVFGSEVIDRMASLSEFSAIGEEGFREAFISAFARGFGAEFTLSELTDAEKRLKDGLIRRRYEDPGWNLSGNYEGPGLSLQR